MLPHLKNIPTELLEEELLKRQNDENKKHQLNENIQKTNQYLKEIGVYKHIGKTVTVSAGSLCVLLEAIYGDRIGVEQHSVIDNVHFQDRDVVSLLESATAETEQKLNNLNV